MREDAVNFRQGVGVAGVLRARDGSRSGGWGLLAARKRRRLKRECGTFSFLYQPWQSRVLLSPFCEFCAF